MPESREDKLIRELLATVKPPPDDYPNWRRGLRWGIVGAVLGGILGVFVSTLGVLAYSLAKRGGGESSFSYGPVIGCAIVFFLLAGVIGAFRPPQERQ